MKPLTEPLNITVTVDGPSRQLSAEVEYIRTTTLEPRPYGTGTTYEKLVDFTVQHIEYLTEDLTKEERQMLDDKINEGPFE